MAQFPKEKVMVMAAPNGARRGHADHQALPVTAQESADDAVTLLEAGASILHLHVRDEAGAHSLDAERYREAIAAVKDRVGNDLVIQVTTEAVGRYSSEEQMALVRELRPEAVSLALREVCPDESSEPVAAEFFAWQKEAGIWPQYILYSADDVARFDKLRRRGIFSDDAPFAMFVLGKYGSGEPGDVSDLNAMLAVGDHSEYPWATCCFGGNENEVMLAATTLGGHVRLGFENNLYLPDGSVAANNAALIQKYLADSSILGREPATANDVRAVFLASFK